MGQLITIAVRSLLQHKTRNFMLGGAVAAVTTLLVSMLFLSTGMRELLLTSATTLSTGHVNVGGFYKVTAGQAAPVVTGYRKIAEIVKKEIPETDYVVQRGRGWAKIVSDTSSMQSGIGGIDITQEPGFKKVVVVKAGRLEDLEKVNSIMIFEEQAKKLEVKVGDTLTVSAPTFKGTNNTIDVTVVAIGQNIGMLSGWSTFMNDKGLRQLYQLNDDTTGALMVYLKDMKDVPQVQGKLRKVLADNGMSMMDNDPRAFWMKFQSVNRENWTGQKLDVTNWEDEVSFMKWTIDGLTMLSVVVTFVLLLLIAAGVMIVMWITIRERTREVGTLRAIGMQQSRVLLMFLLEGSLLGLCGTVVGAALGLLLAGVLNAANIELSAGMQLFLMTDHLFLQPSAGTVVFAVSFITGAITAVSLIPSFIAARLKPVTAMSHVG